METIGMAVASIGMAVASTIREDPGSRTAAASTAARACASRGKGDDDGASNLGAVYTLCMNSDGTFKLWKRSPAQVGLSGALGGGDNLDGDGMLDALVGAKNDDDGGADRGAVYALF